MIRKASVIAVLAAGLFAAMPNTWQKVATSAENFERRFDDLKGAGNSLNPVERVLFSVALANAAPSARK